MTSLQVCSSPVLVDGTVRCRYQLGRYTDHCHPLPSAEFVSAKQALSKDLQCPPLLVLGVRPSSDVDS